MPVNEESVGIERPVFTLKLSMDMNLLMAEQLLDLFDRCVQNRLPIQKESWAFYKQLENLVGEVVPATK